MAPTPGFSGPYPGRLGCRLQGQALGSPGSKAGVRAVFPPGTLGGQKRSLESGREPQGPREPASSPGDHRALNLRPGTCSPVSLPNSPGFCSPGKKTRKGGLSWSADPGASREAGRAGPCGPGSAPRRVSEPILHPLPYTPSTLPSCPPPARLSVCLVKRARREVTIGWRVYEPCAPSQSLGPCRGARRPAPAR